jgi:hypothetical protein
MLVRDMCSYLLRVFAQSFKTYKMPFARPRRCKNHSSTKLIQGAKRRPLEKPYIKPWVMITCTALVKCKSSYLVGDTRVVLTVVEKAAPREEATTKTIPVHIMYDL